MDGAGSGASSILLLAATPPRSRARRSGPFFSNGGAWGIHLEKACLAGEGQGTAQLLLW